MRLGRSRMAGRCARCIRWAKLRAASARSQSVRGRAEGQKEGGALGAAAVVPAAGCLAFRDARGWGRGWRQGREEGTTGAFGATATVPCLGACKGKGLRAEAGQGRKQGTCALCHCSVCSAAMPWRVQGKGWASQSAASRTTCEHSWFTLALMVHLVVCHTKEEEGARRRHITSRWGWVSGMLSRGRMTTT